MPRQRIRIQRTVILRGRRVVLLALLAALFPACARVIAWPSVEPDQDFLQRHIASMESKPFDGVVIQAVVPGVHEGVRLFTWSTLRHRYTLGEFRPVIETLRRVPFRRFRHNFLRINVNPADQPFDMFDEDRWGVLTSNFSLAAAAAREAGLRGLMVDPEAYAEARPGSDTPRFNVFDFRLRQTTNEFAAYQRMALRRGQQVGQAVTAAYPGITVMLAFGPGATCLEGGALPARTYSLLAAFVDGLLAGAAGQATVIEGFELAYSYRSCDRFQEAYASLQGPCRDLSLDPARYAQWLEIGFGLWLDYDSLTTCQDPDVAGRPCRWFDPALYKPEHRHLVDPDRFGRAIAFARAVSDGYVWIYTTQPKWWSEEHPFGENLPDAYVRALEKGRDAVDLSCPRPGQSPPAQAIPKSNR